MDHPLGNTLFLLHIFKLMNQQEAFPIISHIALKVTNLEESTRFYAEVVGLQRVPQPFKVETHTWFGLGPFCQLHLISRGENIPAFHIDHHLAMTTSRFDDFVASLQQKGVDYFDARENRGRIHVRPDGIRQIFFKDPDGYWLEMNDDTARPVVNA